MAEKCGCGGCGAAAKPVKKEEKPVKKAAKQLQLSIKQTERGFKPPFCFFTLLLRANQAAMLADKHINTL